MVVDGKSGNDSEYGKTGDDMGSVVMVISRDGRNGRWW